MRIYIINSLPVKIWLLILLFLFSLNCDYQDDDDDSFPSESNDDDDNDNDSTDDDDDDDDDTTDHDIDGFSTPPTRLFVVGCSSEDHCASWLESDSGWVRFDIPQPELGVSEVVELGPMLALDGQSLLTAWNIYYRDTFTAGHVWLEFTPETGWSMIDMEPVSENSAIVKLGMTPDDVLWIGTQYEIYWHVEEHTTWVFDWPFFYRYSENGPELRGAGTFGFDAWFCSESSNWINIFRGDNQDDLPLLYQYENESWSPVSIATPLDFSYSVNAMVVDENFNGFGTIYNYSDSNMSIYELSANQWTPIDIPDSCADLLSKTLLRFDLVGKQDHLLGYKVYGSSPNLFVEYRNGQWGCNTVTDASLVRFNHGIVYKDDRSYISLYQISSKRTGIFEITEDGIVELEMPEDFLGREPFMAAFGPEAPSQLQIPSPGVALMINK